MNVLWIVTIVFAAAVMQSLTGFGFALVVMPLVTLIVDLRTAAPLIALAGLTIVLMDKGIRGRNQKPPKDVA